MTSKAKRHLLAEIAQALAGLPDDVGPQVLEFVRALASRGQLAGPQQGSSAAAPRNWSSVAGTLRWHSGLEQTCCRSPARLSGKNQQRQI